MSGKNKKLTNMGFSGLFIGLLFIMNPTVNIIDPMPDFIGCIIIFRALMKLSLLESRFDEARSSAKWLGFSSVVKSVLIFFIYGSSATSLETANTTLLCTFVFAIIEVWLVIRLAGSLFGGTAYLATRYSASEIASDAPEAKFYFVSFFIVKTVLVLIPEFLTLFDPRITNEFGSGFASDYKHFSYIKNLTLVLCFLLGIMIFVAAAVYIRRFFKKCSAADGFSESLCGVYESEILTNEKLLIKVNLSNALALLPAAAFFLVNFYIDKVSVIPDFVFFLIAGGAVYFLNKIDRRRERGAIALILTFLGAAVSLIAYLYRFRYANDISFDFNIFFRYQSLTMPLGIISQIFTVAECAVLAERLISAMKLCSGEDIKPRMISFVILSVFNALFGFINYAMPDLNAVYSAAGIVYGIIWFCLALKTFYSVSDDIGWQYKMKI